MADLIDIADLDCIFLTYNEPKKEEFWLQIQNMVPWATRVDGVAGSDAAHKAAADASDTDRFILIDGDNIPYIDFFSLQLELDETNCDKVFRWKARNHINGLVYGNGGLSCWTKDFVYNMQTHEASDGSDDTAVEFCFDPNYWAMNDCYSDTYPNATPEQAWRAGFREGVKMCLDRGSKPTLQEFNNRIVSRNFDNLCIWMSVGADVENGNYAKLGAMLGTYLTMLGDEKNEYGFKNFNYHAVQDFVELGKFWTRVEQSIGPDMVEGILDGLGGILHRRLGLTINNLSPGASKFFKSYFNPSGSRLYGPMVTELEVIRGLV